MKRKVLLVVPHQDDELLVGGGLFKTLARHGEYEAYAVFTTNGDFFAHEAKVRLEESFHVLTGFYGVRDSHIFFLGYGDGWQGGVHLYHQEGEEPLVSQAGRTETYGTKGHEDYRWLKSGRHSPYRREDFKRDLKDVLSEVSADILLVVDFDSHPDHRAASLLVEECLGELFRESPGYRPLVLKRFAYDGVWKGKANFFEIPGKATVLKELSLFPYTESDMLRFAMPDDCVTPAFSDNFLYRAARCYKTQEIWQKADEIINIDEVYFKRDTDNLLFDAALSASSGNPEYLRDFKLFDCADVTRREIAYKECGWKPDEADKERRVQIRFEQPVTVGRIAVYARGTCETDRLKVRFNFDTGSPLCADIRPDGKKNLFTVGTRRNVRDMELLIEEWEGVLWGITELEILPPEESDMPKELEEALFCDRSGDPPGTQKALMKARKAIHEFKKKLSRRMPNSHVLRRHYPELAGRGRVPVGYRMRYMIRRVRQTD